jgi:hypothetical protein
MMCLGEAVSATNKDIVYANVADKIKKSFIFRRS